MGIAVTISLGEIISQCLTISRSKEFPREEAEVVVSPQTITHKIGIEFAVFR